MRKFTKIVLTLSMLFGVAGGVNSVMAEDGTKTPLLLLRNGVINTTDFDITPIVPSTLTTDNLYAATFTSKGGYCNAFKYENYDVSVYDKAVIKYTIEDNSEWHINLPNNDHIALPVGSDQEYVVSLKNIDTYGDFTVFSWNHTGKSITISEVYLFQSSEVELEFDAFGKASVDKSKLSATGGLSYNSSTGVVTSDGTAGELKLEFAAPVDLKYLNYFNVKREGTDGIIDKLYFYDEDGTEINKWGYTKFDNTWRTPGCDDNATKAFLSHKPVKKLVWKAVDNAENAGKTLTIKSIDWTLKTISCQTAGETLINTLAYKEMSGTAASPAWNMNTSTALYYGSNTGDAAVSYADVTEYSEIRIYRNDNTGFRAFFINANGTNVNNIDSQNAASTWNAEGKYWSIDLSKVEKYGEIVALQGIKSRAYNAYDVVNAIVVYKTPAFNTPQYILTGCGMQLAETVAALADANATCIDATGVIGNTTNSEEGRTLLTSANPNCLFLGTAGNGGLANTQNVITSGTCANLVLVDGKPFVAPSAFTATAAKFTKSVSDAGYATMVIPFAAALPTGVKAYNLTSISGTTVVSTDADAITADKPVLIEAAEASYEFTATDAAIAATAEGVFTNGLLNGTYAPSSVVGDGSTIYVLANKSAGAGFYKLAADQKVPEGKAYLVYAGSAPDFIGIEGMNLTGIETVKAAKTNNEIFNLAGQRVAQPAKGLYIVNGRKVVMK